MERVQRQLQRGWQPETTGNPCDQGTFGCTPPPITFNSYKNTFSGLVWVHLLRRSAWFRELVCEIDTRVVLIPFPENVAPTSSLSAYVLHDTPLLELQLMTYCSAGTMTTSHYSCCSSPKRNQLGAWWWSQPLPRRYITLFLSMWSGTTLITQCCSNPFEYYTSLQQNSASPHIDLQVTILKDSLHDLVHETRVASSLQPWLNTKALTQRVYCCISSSKKSW